MKTKSIQLMTILLFAAFMLSAPLAEAATFTVTKLADTNDGTCDADCSLRESIIAANADAAADTIVLGAGEYILSIAGIDETHPPPGIWIS